MQAYRFLRKLTSFGIVLGVCAVAAHAQQGSAAAIRTLEKTRANVETSVAALPNIDCEEHVRSVQIIDNKPRHAIEVDSTVRATRQQNADEFKEERILHKLNGKAPKKQAQVSLPLSLAGGFGNSFSPYLSLKYEWCHEYELVPSGTETKILLEVVDRMENYRDAVCSQFSVQTRARFWLDAESLRILRMEAVSPHAGERIGLKTLSTRTDYALVPLGQNSYLLPVRVHAELARSDGSIAEQYDAEYSKCRRYGATVRILPGVSEVPVKPQ
jgi:hypothetical protein